MRRRAVWAAIVGFLEAATLTVAWPRAARVKVPPIPEAGPLAQPKSIHQVGVPAAATRAAIPPDNPQTPEKIALGQKLFFDGRLSADGTVACSTCHDPARAFTDGRPTSVGIKGRIGQRNAPTILNALSNKTQFWDGRVKTLEEQAALPIVNPVEMGQPSLDAAVARIAAITEYQDAFRKVFGGPPNARDLLRAIASYERTQLSFDSPFDRFIAGDSRAIDDAAKRGWELFNTRARCNKCHALTEQKRDAIYFTDNDIDGVVAFLASLTSADYKDQGIKELARQRELSRTNRPQRDTARAFSPKPQQPKPPRP